jgi:hypothetical protein
LNHVGGIRIMCILLLQNASDMFVATNMLIPKTEGGVATPPAV